MYDRIDLANSQDRIARGRMKVIDIHAHMTERPSA